MKKKNKIIGYMVFESNDQFEQSLHLETFEPLPALGVLNWRDARAGTVFPDKASAQHAINRTEHYRLAYGSAYPEKRFCKIVPVSSI